jgi:hypothetical protein
MSRKPLLASLRLWRLISWEYLGGFTPTFRPPARFAPDTRDLVIDLLAGEAVGVLTLGGRRRPAGLSETNRS